MREAVNKRWKRGGNGRTLTKIVRKWLKGIEEDKEKEKGEK